MILITIAKKPINTSITKCVLKNGCGSLNIAATRIGTKQRKYKGSGVSQQRYTDGRAGLTDGRGKELEFNVEGRWPANLIVSPLSVDGFPYTETHAGTYRNDSDYAGTSYTILRNKGDVASKGNSGSASRYFKVFGDKK